MARQWPVDILPKIEEASRGPRCASLRVLDAIHSDPPACPGCLMLSTHGVCLEDIRGLVGHGSTPVTEPRYRHEIWSMVTEARCQRLSRAGHPGCRCHSSVARHRRSADRCPTLLGRDPHPRRSGGAPGTRPERRRRPLRGARPQRLRRPRSRTQRPRTPSGRPVRTRISHPMARAHRTDQLRRPRKRHRRSAPFVVTRPERPTRHHPLPARP
jgi:hypothetical protein